ncbi:MAG TPA: hypothetical protein VII51_02800 [Gaiellaceae bacterium]
MDDRDAAVATRTGVSVEACVGWSVSSPDGRLGVVDGLLLDPDGGVEWVDVRSGLFHARHELVELEDVLLVVPERRLLVVR